MNVIAEQDVILEQAEKQVETAEKAYHVVDVVLAVVFRVKSFVARLWSVFVSDMPDCTEVPILTFLITMVCRLAFCSLLALIICVGLCYLPNVFGFVSYCAILFTAIWLSRKVLEFVGDMIAPLYKRHPWLMIPLTVVVVQLIVFAVLIGKEYDYI